jgi:hypothetical protein
MVGDERSTARIIDYFETLGSRVAAEWRVRHWKAEQLPEVARLALEEMPPPEPPDAVIDWTLSRSPLPDQRDRANFGDHAHIAYRHPAFRIEVLHWIDGTTSIHEHAFAGAFRLWRGSSIHSVYAFEEHERLGNTCFGSVNFRHTELLTAGSVREILLGRSFSHALFHLERPSVTIVVRSHGSPWHVPQLEYLPPFGASSVLWVPDQYQTAISLVNMIRRLRPHEFMDALVTAIEHLDLDSATALLMEHCGYLASSPEQLERVIAVLRRNFGETTAALKQSVLYRARSMHIIAKRDRVYQPDHRYLLACLLNIPTRTGILEMIRARVPERDPLTVLTGWLGELVDLPSPIESEPNLLGFRLSGTPLDVFRLLVAGRSAEAIAKEVKRANPEFDESPDMIREFAAALARAPLFVPLFSEPKVASH